MSRKTIIGPDYDPASGEVLYDSKGNPITQEYIDEVSAEAEAGYELDQLTPVRMGRPSLSESGDSPQIRFRVPTDIRTKAKKVAKREGKTVSQLARAAVEEYLERHAA